MAGVLRGIFVLLAIFAVLNAESFDENISSDEEEIPSDLDKVTSPEVPVHDFAADLDGFSEDLDDNTSKGKGICAKQLSYSWLFVCLFVFAFVCVLRSDSALVAPVFSISAFFFEAQFPLSSFPFIFYQPFAVR